MSKWKEKILEDLVFVDKEQLNNSTDPDFSFYYIDIGSVSTNQILFPDSPILFRGSPSRARKILHDGDVLMATVRPNLKAFAKFKKPLNRNCIASTGFAVLSKKEGADINFIYYSLFSYALEKQIETLVVGSNYPALNTSDIRKLKVLTPSLHEQRQIATILSTADAVIEKTQAAIAKYKAIKQGLLQDLFTCGIDTVTGKLRPSYQDAPELYKESKLGWIPKDWEVERIDKLCQITTGNKDTQNKLEYGEYPFFVRSQTVEKINSYSYDGEAILTAGDGVGVGKIYHYINGKFDFHQRVYMLYEFEKIIAPKYLFYYFSTNFLAEVDRCSAKTTVDSVRMEMIAGMIVPLPNISEQISIAEKLISLESKLKTEEDFLHKQQQIKAGLMGDLLSGKKKVKI